MKKMRAASMSKKKTFTFGNSQYEYLYNDYNMTWGNERTVEVPIIWRAVNLESHENVLEVGNVLSHYFHVHHLVIDKYEKMAGLINEDIVDFNPQRKFKLIVSISTLEHVGWDERPREVRKPLRAIRRMRSLCQPGGRIYFTVPIGSNPYIDELIGNGFQGELSSMRFLRRINFENEWVESNRDYAQKLHYGEFSYSSKKFPPFPYANAIMVGEVTT